MLGEPPGLTLGEPPGSPRPPPLVRFADKTLRVFPQTPPLVRSADKALRAFPEARRLASAVLPFRSGTRADGSGRVTGARPCRRGRSRRPRRRARAFHACRRAASATPRAARPCDGTDRTMVISRSAPPTRTRCPSAHEWTSAPSTVTFSRIAPGSTPSASRCCFDTSSTSLRGGLPCAHPSRPWLSTARTCSRSSERPLPRPGETKRPATVAIRAAYP